MYNVGEPATFFVRQDRQGAAPNTPRGAAAPPSRRIFTAVSRSKTARELDYIFSWHGNTELIIAIIKLVEDKMNADETSREGGVQAILLVEDSIRFYSTYLPEIYKLILLQNTEFLRTPSTSSSRCCSKRARRKSLARCYEEAVELYERYKKNLLGVISDVGFVLHRNDPPESEKTRRRHRPLPPHPGG